MRVLKRSRKAVTNISFVECEGLRKEDQSIILWPLQNHISNADRCFFTNNLTAAIVYRDGKRYVNELESLVNLPVRPIALNSRNLVF